MTFSNECDSWQYTTEPVRGGLHIGPFEITDEMVESAGRAMNLEAGRQRGLAFDDDWDEITEQDRGGWRLCARAALNAALPGAEA